MSGRAVLEVAGSDREGFLQGLVTNDLRRLEGGLVHAALLTPQGKYLADFFLKRDGERILLDVAAGALPDPRHPAMGWRLYGAEGGDDGTDWDRIRVEHVIPETGIELGPETYVLEAGFERLNGVDFRKGCYVGQEVTARMKHKTELRKGLVRVLVEGAAPAGTPVLTADGREAGVLHTQAGGRGIAHLRLDRAGGPMTAGEARVEPDPDWRA